VPKDLMSISYPVSPSDVLNTAAGWESIVANTQPLQGKPRRDGAELATIIYTSGTTGKPKGVMHSFASFAWALQTGLKRIPMHADDRMLSYLPLAHVVERVLVEHGWLHTGMRVWFAESLDTFAQDLQRARPTIFFSVPRLWVKFQQGVHHKLPEPRLERLLRIPIIRGIIKRKVLVALGLDQCRFAAGGAAPMPVALLQWYRRLGLQINEGYGMTENLAVSHLTVPGVDQQGSVGPGYDGVQTRIDEASGEIQMTNQALMLGYYKEPALSGEAFTSDGWLKTGDRGHIDSKGLLYITGRVKDLFKTSKGKYVAPAPIEDKLSMHDTIEACVVTGANLGQPIGIAMLNEQAAGRLNDAAYKAELGKSLAQHLESVNQTLDPHERLACLVMVAEPWTVENDLITPTFKVKRNRIDAVFTEHFERWLAQRRPIVWHLDRVPLSTHQ
jgi:long-chain acyl-CoA synthetase